MAGLGLAGRGPLGRAALALCLLFLCLAAAAASGAGLLEGRILRIADGDTLTVLVGGPATVNARLGEKD